MEINDLLTLAGMGVLILLSPKPTQCTNEVVDFPSYPRRIDTATRISLKNDTGRILKSGEGIFIDNCFVGFVEKKLGTVISLPGDEITVIVDTGSEKGMFVSLSGEVNIGDPCYVQMDGKASNNAGVRINGKFDSNSIMSADGLMARLKFSLTGNSHKVDKEY